MRNGEYLTMLDPFQIKYGKAVTACQSLASLVIDFTWVPSTLTGFAKDILLTATN